MEKRAIYIHIPFCHHKCGYCDFLSFSGTSLAEREEYVEYIKKEIELYGNGEDYGVSSIFFGGGTPSVLSYEMIEDIYHSIEKHFKVEAGCEITLEANPESYLTLKMPMAHPFNRLSLGVQSASSKLLKVAERIHSVDMARDAFYKGRRDGFLNINLDFISSIPGEGREDVDRTLALIQELNPEHVSLYSLILEEGTAFYENQQRYPWLSEEEDRAHIHTYQERLEELGYEQYEISNYAKEDFSCRHNMAYWQGRGYLGFGLGAHSFVGKRRYWNERTLSVYYEKIRKEEPPVAGYEDLTPVDRANEIIMLALRMNEGLEMGRLLPTGQIFEEVYREEIDESVQEGLGKVVDNHFRLTKRGMDLANIVEERFFRL